MPSASNLRIDRYRNVPFFRRDCCMICETSNGSPLIDLPRFPLTELYVQSRMTEELALADQAFLVCPSCGHGQLITVVDPSVQYDSESGYHFRTSLSISGRENADYFVQFLKNVVGDTCPKSVIDIGCNDLYVLRSLRQLADRLIGVDPVLANVDIGAEEDGILVIDDFFENVELDHPCDVVICKDTLEHVSDPKRFVRKMVDKAHEDTTFVFQFPILETLVADCRFDQIFHQHLNYFTWDSFQCMLRELGCSIVDCTINYEHWGALLVAFRRKASFPTVHRPVTQVTRREIVGRYASFRDELSETAKRLQYFSNEILYGYGAALMLPVLSYHMGSDLSSLQCVLDDDPGKDGMYYINLPVPIRHTDKIHDIQSSVVLLTAIASKINVRRILSKLLALGPKHIISPLRTI